MAGRGHRFIESGYQLPKPMIDVQGKPMIARVLENIAFDARYIFIIRKDHAELLKSVLYAERPDCIVIEIEYITEGAACTCLLAKEHINNDEHLLVANCDQIMEWNPQSFLEALKQDVDGYILTFASDSPSYSYAKVNRHGYVTRVAEKEVISNVATTGVYHWSRGSYMIDSCEQMISKQLRHKGEFYLCPSYNEMIEDGLIVKTVAVEKHHPIGTPQELETYLAH
jgi:dTDP-glucose pyrophosphorylase